MVIFSSFNRLNLLDMLSSSSLCSCSSVAESDILLIPLFFHHLSGKYFCAARDDGFLIPISKKYQCEENEEMSRKFDAIIFRNRTFRYC